MAIDRLSLTMLRVMIRRAIGEPDSADSILTDAQLTDTINAYSLNISFKATRLHQQRDPRYRGVVRFGQWRDVATITGTSGSSTIYLPIDYDQYISFYDETAATSRHPIYPIVDVNRWFSEGVREAPPGPSRRILLLNWELNGSAWQRRADLWPSVQTGVTPSVVMYYWRLPAALVDSAPTTNFPDADPKFHRLWVVGPVLELMRSNDPTYERWFQEEQALLAQMVEADGVI